MNNKKLKIAITGGIGTGKSAVARFYEKQGYTVISADDVAKDILSNDLSVKQQIIENFGKESFKNEKPDFKYLANKVFAVSRNVKIINGIVHPPTIRKIKLMMDEALEKNNLVFVEAALIFEAKMEDLFDYIILITAERAKQIERVMERNKISEEEIIKRMENQLPENIKKAKSDFIIENNSSLEELENRALFVLNLLKNIAGQTEKFSK